jgi:plasmid stabilization system protein ParE
LVESPYLILYEIVGDRVEIAAFIHGARDLPTVLAKRFPRDS